MIRLVLFGLLLSETLWGALDKIEVKAILQMPFDNRQLLLSEHSMSSSLLEEIVLDSKEHYEVRWDAMTALAHFYPEKAAIFIDNSIHHKEWFIRNNALLALEKISPERAHKAAKILLEDRAMVVRAAAVRVIKNLSFKDLKTNLWEEFFHPRNKRKDQSLWIRDDLIETLVYFTEPGDEDIWIRVLKKEDTRFYMKAIQALEKITGLSFGQKNESLDYKRFYWMNWAQTKNIKLERVP